MGVRWRERECAYPRMIPALDMMLDAGVDEACLDDFIAIHHTGDEELSAEDWWLRLKLFTIDWNEARGTFERSMTRKRTPDDKLGDEER